MASGESKDLSDIFFEPLEEVKKELVLVPHNLDVSLAKHMYTDDAEDSINQQIKSFFFSDRLISSTFFLFCYFSFLLTDC